MMSLQTLCHSIVTTTKAAITATNANDSDNDTLTSGIPSYRKSLTSVLCKDAGLHNSRCSDSGKSSSCSPTTMLECSFDSGIAGVNIVDNQNMLLHKRIQQFQRILLALERDREHFYILRERLSKLNERNRKKSLDERHFCNVCCTEINPEDVKSFVKCWLCLKSTCRSFKCASWLPKVALWECDLCQKSKESMAQTSSWVAEQFSFNEDKLVYPLRARSEIFIPINECNDNTINFDSVSQTGANSTIITAEQKLKIREYVEEIVSKLLGGNLDTISVNQLSKSENYLQVFDKHHLALSEIFLNMENALNQRSLLQQGDLSPPKSVEQNGTILSNGDITTKRNYNQNNADFGDISEARLRQMIQKIIAETMSMPPLTMNHAVSEVALDRPSKTSAKHTFKNGYRHRTEHYFEPKIYQDLLATAVLNKIVDTQGNNRIISESTPDLSQSNQSNDMDQNYNVENQSTSSGSSVEPRSDCSYSEMDRILNNQINKPAESPLDPGRESTMSDYLAGHMVPLPDLSNVPTESEEDDFVSITSSAKGEGTWEHNWLFKKKHSSLGGSGTTATILIPIPKEDVRAQIGDKATDEVSDLSELGSETDDSSSGLLSTKMDPLNDRLLNKHIIGGQNSKSVLDELIESSSVPINNLPSEQDETYTDTLNEHVVDAPPKNEAINDEINKIETMDSETERKPSTECETEDVDIPAEGCLGFSQVEIIDASERTPSVIEILAAVALAPMIAVPAADQPAALTSAELSTLHELTDLALTEIKTRAGEVTAHDLEVIPEEPNDITLQEEFLIDLKNLPPPPALDDMSTDYIIENLILKPPDEIVELVTYIPIVEPPPEIEQETVESEQTNAKAIALQAGTSSVGEASQLLDTTHSREQTVLHESIAIEENQSVDEIKSNLAQVVEGNSMSLGIEKPAITEEIPEMLEVQQKVINERWSSGDKNEGFQPETVIKTNAKVAKEDLTSSDIIATETSEAILAKVEAEHLLAEEKRDRSSGERISVLQPESIVEIEAAVASPDTNNSPSFETKEDGDNVAQKDGSTDPTKSNLQPESVVETETQVAEKDLTSSHIIEIATTEESSAILDVKDTVGQETQDPSSEETKSDLQPESLVGTEKEAAEKDLTLPDVNGPPTSETTPVTPDVKDTVAKDKQDRFSEETKSDFQPEFVVKDETEVTETDLASPNVNELASNEAIPLAENTVAQHKQDRSSDKTDSQLESVAKTVIEVTEKDLTSSNIKETATSEAIPATLEVEDTVAHKTQDRSSDETKSNLQAESVVKTETEAGEKDLTLSDINEPATSKGTPPALDAEDMVGQETQDGSSDETISDIQPESVVKTETEVSDKDLTSSDINEPESSEPNPVTLEVEDVVAQQKQDRSSDETKSDIRPDSIAKTETEVAQKDLTSSVINEPASCEATPPTLDAEDTVAQEAQDQASDKTKSNIEAESVVKAETEVSDKDFISSNINEPESTVTIPTTLEVEDAVVRQKQDRPSDGMKSDIDSIVKTETEVVQKDLTSSDINKPPTSEATPPTVAVEAAAAQEKQDRSSDETKSDIQPESIVKTETEVNDKDMTSTDINEQATNETIEATPEVEGTILKETQDRSSDEKRSDLQPESVAKTETEVSDKDLNSSDINEPESSELIPVTLEVEDVVAQQKQDRFSDGMKSDIQSDSIAKTETEVVQKDLTSSDISEPATSEATPPTVDVEAAAAQEKQGRSSDEANLQPEFVTKTETEVAEKDLTSSDVNELATSEATEATSDAEGTVAQETQDRSSDETISDIQPESVLKTETEVSDKDLTSSDINEPESSEPIPVTLEVEDMIAQQKQDRSSDEMKSDIQSDSIAKTETEIPQKDLTSSDISEPATSEATPPTVDVEAAAAQEKQDRSSDETKLQPEFATKTETEVAEKDLTSSDVNELPTSEATPATLDVGDTAAQETQDQPSDERKPDLKPAVIARAKVISSDVNNSVTSETTPATVEVKSTVEHEEHVESSDETRSDLRLESTQQTEQKIGEEYITSMGLSGQDKLLESISDISVQALELIREEPKLDESNIASDLESSEIPILEPPAGFNEECETNIAVEEKETNESNVEKIIKENEEKASSEKLLFNMEEKVKSSETIHSTINQLISTENELTFTEKKETFEIEQSRAKTNLNLHEELFSVAEKDENLSIKKSRHPSLGVIECQPTIIETFAISFEESTDNAFTDATTADNLSRETSSCSFVATQRAKGNEDLEESAALKAQEHSTALSTQHTPQEVLEKALIGKPEEESKSSEKEAMVLLGPLPHEGSKVGEEAINAQNPSTENQQLNADAQAKETPQVTVEEQSHEERNVNIEMNANSPSPSQDEVIPPPVAFESEYILTNQSCETSAENAVKTVNLLAENSAIKNESIPDNIESSQASITKFETNPENLKVIEEKAEESSQFPQEKTIVEEQAGKLDSTAVSTEIVVPIVDSTMPDTSQKAATTSTIKSNEIIPSADINSTKEGHETRQPSEILPCVGADIQKNVLSDSPNISVVVPAREATTIASHVTTPSTEINSASENRETSQPAETSPSAEAVLHKTVLTDTPDTSVIATQDPDTNSACNETNRSNEVTSANEGQKIIQPSGIEKIGNYENISIALDPEIIQSCASLPGLVALNGTAITEDNVTEPKENVLISICNEKIKDSANSGEEEFVRSTEPLSTSIKIAIQEEILTQQGEKTDENSANISSIESSEATTLTSVINVAGKQTECKNDPIESEIPTVCCQSSTEPASIVKDEKTPIPAKEEIDSTKHLPKTSSEETVVSSSELSNSSATSVNVEESVVSETIVNAFATSNLRALDLEKSSVEQLSTKKEPQTSLEHASMDAIEIGSANLSKEQAPEIPIQEQHTLMKSEISTMALIDSGKEHVPDVLIQEEYEIQISETPLVDTSKEQVSEELIQGQHTQVKSELNHEDPKLTVLTKQETLTFDQTVSEKSRMEIIPENITTNVAHVSLLQTLNQEHLETSSATTSGSELRDPSDVINQGQKSLSQNQRFDSAEENLIKSSIPSADEILKKSSDETNENIAAFTADRAAIPVQKLDTVKDILLSAEPSAIAEDLATKISEIKLTQTATILKEEQSLQISPKLTMINEENSEIAMGYTIAEISDQPSRNNALVSENIFEVGKAEQSIEAVTAPNLEKHYASEEQATQNLKEIDIPSGSTESEQKELKAPADSIELKQEPVVPTICEAATNQPLTGLLSQFTTDSNTIESVDAIDIIAPPIMFATPDTVTNKVVEPEKPVNVPSAPIASNKFNTKPLEENALACLSDSYTIVEPIKVRNSSLEAKEAHLSTESTATSTTSDKTVIEVLNVKPQQAVEACHSIPNEVKKSSVLDREPAQLVTATSYNLPMSSQKLLTNSNPAENLNKYRFLTDVVVSDQLETVSNGTIKSNESTEHLYNINDSGIEAIVSLENQSQSNLNLVTISTKVTLETDKTTFSETNLKFGVKEKIFCEEKKLRIESEKLLTESYRDSITTLKPIKAEDIPLMNRTNVSEEKEELDSTLAKEQLQISATGSKDIVKKIRDSDSVDFIASDSSKSDPLPAKENIQELIANALRETAELKSSSHTSTHITVDVEKEVSECTITGPEHRPTSLINEETISLAEKNFSELTITNRNEKLAPSSEILEAKKESLQTSASEVLLKPDLNIHEATAENFVERISVVSEIPTLVSEVLLATGLNVVRSCKIKMENFSANQAPILASEEPLAPDINISRNTAPETILTTPGQEVSILNSEALLATGLNVAKTFASKPVEENSSVKEIPFRTSEAFFAPELNVSQTIAAKTVNETSSMKEVSIVNSEVLLCAELNISQTVASEKKDKTGELPILASEVRLSPELNGSQTIASMPEISCAEKPNLEKNNSQIIVTKVEDTNLAVKKNSLTQILSKTESIDKPDNISMSSFQEGENGNKNSSKAHEKLNDISPTELRKVASVSPVAEVDITGTPITSTEHKPCVKFKENLTEFAVSICNEAESTSSVESQPECKVTELNTPNNLHLLRAVKEKSIWNEVSAKTDSLSESTETMEEGLGSTIIKVTNLVISDNEDVSKSNSLVVDKSENVAVDPPEIKASIDSAILSQSSTKANVMNELKTTLATTILQESRNESQNQLEAKEEEIDEKINETETKELKTSTSEVLDQVTNTYENSQDTFQAKLQNQNSSTFIENKDSEPMLAAVDPDLCDDNADDCKESISDYYVPMTTSAATVRRQFFPSNETQEESSSSIGSSGMVINELANTLRRDETFEVILAEAAAMEVSVTPTNKLIELENAKTGRTVEDCISVKNLGNHLVLKKLRRQACVSSDTAPSLEDDSQESKKSPTTNALGSICQQYIQDKRLLAALETRRRQTLLMHRFLSSFEESPHSSMENELIAAYQSTVELTDANSSRIGSVECSSINSEDSSICDCDNSYLVGERQHENSFHIFNNILFSDQITNEYCSSNNTPTTDEEFIEIGLDVEIEHKQQQSQSNHNNNNNNINNTYVRLVNNNGNAIPTTTPNTCNKKKKNNGNNNNNHNKNNIDHHYHHYHHNNTTSGREASAVEVTTLKAEQILIGQNNKIEDYKDDDIDNQILEREHVDDMVAVQPKFVPGSIAEREYLKWHNAVDMPNNPYAPEALKKRINGSQERCMDLPNISPGKEANPLEHITKEKLNDETDNKREIEYKRYSRDYYINNVSKSNESPSKSGSAEQYTEGCTTLKATNNSPPPQSNDHQDVLYKAVPAQVTVADDIGSSIENISQKSPKSANTSTSDDTDTVRIYDFKKQETIKVRSEVTPQRSEEEKGKENTMPTADRAKQLNFNRSESVGRGSTPSAFKFLQPKRRLIDPSHVMSLDEDERPLVSPMVDKPVIEKEVAEALPSVKALAKAFLLSSSASQTSQTEKPDTKKAKISPPLVQKKSIGPGKLSSRQEADTNEDATITSDLSSLDTDPSIVEITKDQECEAINNSTATTTTIPAPSAIKSCPSNTNTVPVREGVLKNNIAFFENLKFK